MKPNSFSASALEVAGQCDARYKAEYLDRGRDFQGNAAGVGIVCHGTFEDFIRTVCIRKSHGWDETLFLEMFNENFTKVFGSVQGTLEYDDALRLSLDWFHREGLREYFEETRVLSLEAKNSFMVKFKPEVGHPPQKFNYIMDRVDRLDETTVKVVDYKSQRVPLTESQLRNKKQARYYALAIQVIYPNTELVWVEFDFLRSKPITVSFTKDDNIATYRELQRSVLKVLETPDDRVTEQLNPNCGWCVRKASCKTLQRHIQVGGIMSKSIDELTEIYSKLKMQEKGQKELVGQIEMMLLQYAIENDTLEFETDAAEVTVIAPTRRSVNKDIAAVVLGASASEYANYTVTTIDKLTRRSSPLPSGQRELLKSAIEVKIGDPEVSVKLKD